MLVKVGTQQQVTAKQGQIHDGARVSLLCYDGNILCVITTSSISEIEHACQTSICEICSSFRTRGVMKHHTFTALENVYVNQCKYDSNTFGSIIKTHLKIILNNLIENIFP